jgi:hypothetical protein
MEEDQFGLGLGGLRDACESAACSCACKHYPKRGGR